MIDLAPITPPETFPALAPDAVFKAWTALRIDFLGTADRPVVRAVTVTDLHAGTRKCRDCGLIKPLDAFTRNKTQAMGHTYQCKPCRNQMRQEHRMDVRAANGSPPAVTRTRRAKTEPKPKPVKAVPPAPQPVAVAPIEPPRKTLKDRIAERRVAAS